ncbi:MAG: NAD(P)-dependent glycerol-3-phosphate dehydrogenase [Phycisphaeraceae bacterium]|nr:NAD(P)-dependent glycerol-3-phosphate dehydrogenase [Phycisphaeraceae bacterium]
MAKQGSTGRPGGGAGTGEGAGARPRVAILGLGQMGLVCAGILGGRSGGAGPGPEVVMWGHSVDEAGELTQTRRSDRLPGFSLPESIRVTDSERAALRGADLIVVAIPVQFIRSVFERIRKHVPAGVALLSVAKGIENETLLTPTRIMLDALGEAPGSRPVGVLSGPTIAGELARCLPATMIAASDDAALAERVQGLFSTSYLRVYTSEDVLGVELAGAVKNVIAIAAGGLDGLQAGYNAKSALLARGLAEITRLGVAMGASRETFFGLAGAGDLATTCFSPEGRNRSCGEALGRGEKLDDYLKRVKWVVEGVATAKSVMGLARKFDVEMPIASAVYAVLYKGMDPIDGIGRLMSRELKAERVG